MNEEKKEILLNQFYEDVSLCKDYLKTLRHEILNQDISNYPIFVATEVPVDIGRLVISKKELDIQWSFYASHLEDFVNKGIVELEKVEEFKKLYKANDSQLCFFLIMGGDFSFVFLPQ